MSTIRVHLDEFPLGPRSKSEVDGAGGGLDEEREEPSFILNLAAAVCGTVTLLFGNKQWVGICLMMLYQKL